MTCLNRDPPELRRDVMLSQTNAHRLAITNLGHVGAHIRCLRIIDQMCCSTFDLSRLQAETQPSGERQPRTGKPLTAWSRPTSGLLGH